MRLIRHASFRNRKREEEARVVEKIRVPSPYLSGGPPQKTLKPTQRAMLRAKLSCCAPKDLLEHLWKCIREKVEGTGLDPPVYCRERWRDMSLLIRVTWYPAFCGRRIVYNPPSVTLSKLPSWAQCFLSKPFMASSLLPPSLPLCSWILRTELGSFLVRR